MVKKSLKVLVLLLAVYLSAVDCVQYKKLSFSHALYQKVAPSVVYVSMLDPDGKPYHGGTGFQVEDATGKSYIITNAHVCRIFSPNNYVVIKTDDGQVFFRHILQISDLFDLCVVDSVSSLPSLHLANRVRSSERISIVGHPLLHPTKVTSGHIIGNQVINVTEDGFTISGTFSAVISDAEAKPGNSGSPVVNDKGEVIGVLFAGNDSQSCIVSLADLKNFLP